MSLLLDCVYLVAGALLAPLWLYKLPQAPRYRAGLLHRLGLSPRMAPGVRRLWVHCASVGEASIPRRLLARFKERWPDWQVVLSTNTDTGAARLRELYPGDPVFYMPLDFSPCVRLALSRVAPDVVMLVELELWPNFAQACRARGVPVVIVNGRIGGRSRRALELLDRIWRSLWDAVRVCCARSADDAAGFVQAGLPAERVSDCGMLKCDGLAFELDAEQQDRLAGLFGIERRARVIVAGSTHVGEEVLLTLAYKDLKIRHRDLRMIVVPRHIERARAVAAAVRARGLSAALKTDLDAGRVRARGDEIIVVDTIGDLVACYGLATCVFVGRSIRPPGGGQNVLEAAALARPVLTGPHTANFRPEMSMLRQAGAAVVVRDRRDLVRELDRLLSEPEAALRMGRAGRDVLGRGQGATERTLSKLTPLFDAV